MRLDEWIEREGRGARARIARSTGLSWQSVDKLARGETRAQADTAIAIERATNGEVTAEELLALDELRAAQK